MLAAEALSPLHLLRVAVGARERAGAGIGHQRSKRAITSSLVAGIDGSYQRAMKSPVSQTHTVCGSKEVSLGETVGMSIRFSSS